MIATSREIIGKYERGENIPLIDVAAKIADTLEVSPDYLAEEGSKTGFDRKALKRINEIEELEHQSRINCFSWQTQSSVMPRLVRHTHIKQKSPTSLLGLL